MRRSQPCFTHPANILSILFILSRLLCLFSALAASSAGRFSRSPFGAIASASLTTRCPPPRGSAGVIVGSASPTSRIRLSSRCRITSHTRRCDFIPARLLSSYGSYFRSYSSASRYVSGLWPPSSRPPSARTAYFHRCVRTDRATTMLSSRC